MTQRLLLLVAGLLVAALCGGFALHLLALRDALGAELRQRPEPLARAAVAALAPAAADPAALAAEARRWAAQPGVRSLVVASAGQVVFDNTQGAGAARATAAAGAVPAWFERLIAPTPVVGEATLDGPGELRLRLEADPAPALAVAWRSTQLWLAGMLVLAAVVALAVVLLLQRWRRALAAAVAQAQAVEDARLPAAMSTAMAASTPPELAEISRTLNATVLRLRGLFDAQAAQVAQLQQQVQTDAVTGLPVRDQFVGRLGDLLSDPAGPAVALLLVRVPGLERLNERHGREATDRLLAALADVLLTYVERVPGTCAGRLNGTDFALGLPAAGIARETAETVQRALEATPAARLAGARFLFGGCDGLRDVPAGAALAAADAALARAEVIEPADGGAPIAIDDLPDHGPGAGNGGSRAWRERLEQALVESRVQIAAFPVVDTKGALIHLECPLRVQLDPGGEYLVARRWLALAARSRLMPEIDLAAIDLALAAIRADGRPRCVHVAPRSFASMDFAAHVQARLEAAPTAARRLSIEWTDSEGAAASAALRSAVALWRQAGVTIGVEHAGASPKALPALKDIGVQYVKVDARHLRGVADDESVRGYAQSLVTLIHSLGLAALAEGIDEARDLLALWALGFDGATGAAVPGPGR
jgi:EAL domain-containing protein (putative c-di-GMP-specific phosphodiesterase class I)/GGDEF domain-containing protein